MSSCSDILSSFAVCGMRLKFQKLLERLQIRAGCS